MSSKNNTEVIIEGKIYILSGYESEEYLQKVATYINNKIAELRIDGNFKKHSLEVQRTLIDLNIADDYFKTKERATNLESKILEKDKEIYDLKHELISAQLQTQECEKEIEKLKEEMNAYQKEIVRLETTISDIT